MSAPTLDEICVVNLADAFRGDGEILCNPIGTVPMCAGRLARATWEPDMVYTDGVSVLPANDFPVGMPDAPRVPESYVPYRTIFDIVWSGKRHVVMGASQMDMWGNQNFAAIGDDYSKPKVQLLGMRGAPGNLINHVTSYWIPNHSTRVFVPEVDVVSGPGYSRTRELPEASRQFHEIRRIVTKLAVMDFETPDNRMRLRSVHPGVTVDDVVENTGFELVIEGEVPESRPPTDEELRVLREVIDPTDARKAEFE
ncbi:MAG: CoA-transferase [Acidimicrobiales bacterium]|nr:CoA-transferase [Acidimicrobiales bacterium]